MAESFFATLACELLSRSSLRTYVEARGAVFDYIAVFYINAGVELTQIAKKN